MQLDIEFHRGFWRENPVHMISLNGLPTAAEASAFGHKYSEIPASFSGKISQMRVCSLNGASRSAGIERGVDRVSNERPDRRSDGRPVIQGPSDVEVEPRDPQRRRFIDPGKLGDRGHSRG